MADTPSKNQTHSTNSEPGSKYTVHQLEYLVDITRYLTESLDVQEVLQRIATGAVEIVAAAGCAIYLLEDDGETLTPMVVIDPQYKAEILATPLNIDTSFTGYAVKAGQGVIFNDADGNPIGQKIPGMPDEDESILCVPFIADGKKLGAMTLNKIAEHFTTADLTLAEAFARYAAIALKNAQAYRVIQENETRFRMVSELTSDYAFAFRVEPDGTLVNEWVTGALQRIIGYSAAELRARGGWPGIVYPDDLMHSMRQLKNLLANQSGVVEYRIITKKGDIRWMRDYARPEWSDAAQRVVRIFGAVQDITEKKRAEIALRESEARFRALFDGIPAICWTFDRDGRILEWNKTAEQVYGWSAEEAVGKTMFELMVRPENVEQTKRGIESVFRGEEIHDMEFTDVCADGTTCTVLAHEYPLRDATRQVIKGICAELDITARKQAEEDRERALNQYQSLAENAPYGLAQIERETAVRYLNSKFTKLYGYDINDIPDMPTWFQKLFPDPEYREMVRTTWMAHSQQLEGGKKEPPSPIFTVTSKDGRAVITQFYGIKLDDGSFLITLEDITAQKEAEAALKESEARLRQAQKMESIGTLAGGIAHDFNNLLTAINGNAELALMKLKGNHPARKNVEGTIAAGNRAARLTSQLLAFSRRQMYRPQKIYVNQLVEGLDNMLRHLIREDIAIETNLAPNLAPINADPHQLEQILVNLMVNARDAIYEQTNPARPKKITIETAQVYLDDSFTQTHPGSAPGHYIHLCVSDTGVGMAEAVKDKIFEPFFTTKPKGRGTGLGLATVYGIVKQNKGNIFVYSEPGIGTTFKIYWPLADQSALAEQFFAEEPPPLLEGNETILLVEDDPQVRAFATDSLRALGYRLLVAENGEKALDLLAQQHTTIDLLLTDVIMPQMDGPQLADTLQKQMPALPVLFMSGYTDDLVGRKGLLAQEINFLQKPFSTRTLAHKVRSVLDTQSKGL